jgi:hypothetical protein
MQRNSNRKGLALGAALSLLVSLFATVPAANAATDGANIGAYPVAGTTFAGTVVEDFPVFVQLKPGQTNTAFASNKLVYKVEKTAGTNMDVRVSASGTVVDGQTWTSVSPSVASQSEILIQAGSTSATLSGVVLNGIGHLNFKASSASGVASWSAVTLKITAWIDDQGGANNYTVDSDEWFTTFNVTLTTTGAIASTLTAVEPGQGGNAYTVSGTVTGLNLENLSGKFFIAASSSAALFDGDGDSLSNSSVITSSPLTAPAAALRAGVVSSSFNVYTVPAKASFSAALRYQPTGTTNTIYDGYLLGSVVTAGASANTITTLVTTVEESDHATASGQSVPVRPNQTYTVKVHAATGSTSVSGAVVKVALSSNATLGLTTKLISVNGGAATTSFPTGTTALSITTGADGYASFTVATTGFAANDTLVVNASSGTVAASALTMTATAPAYSIVNDYSIYASTPGAVAKIGYAVEDQWGVALKATDYRIQVTRGGTGFAYATTVSEVAVVAGAATFEFTPAPATKTGSAVVSAVLQKFDTALNAWISGGSADANVTVTVTDVTSVFSVAPAVSVAASVSYFPSTVSWKTVTGTVKNAGADIEVSGDGLVFRAADGKATVSGKLIVRSGANGVYTFDVASLKVGKHTISQKVGATTSTTLLVVDPVTADSGTSISFDKSALVSGETAKITGTLVDVNGNGVNTSGSADVVVSWAGLGLPFGTGTLETDADGKFSINVLVLATEVGTGTITATYRPAGDAASTKNVTVAKALTIGTPAAEVNAVIGSFNGRWAVRVENAKGSAVTIKVGGNWYKVTATSDSFVFSRKSRVGATPLVKVWVDGALQNEQTVTVK